MFQVKSSNHEEFLKWQICIFMFHLNRNWNLEWKWFLIRTLQHSFNGFKFWILFLIRLVFFFNFYYSRYHLLSAVELYFEVKIHYIYIFNMSLQVVRMYTKFQSLFFKFLSRFLQVMPVLEIKKNDHFYIKIKDKFKNFEV